MKLIRETILRKWAVSTLCAWMIFVAMGCGGRQPRRRVYTEREGARELQAPEAGNSFSFVVLGDRTTGTREGLEILERAVDEINLIDPDFVITVGDMIQGYTDRPAWLEQMEEYRAVMGRLNMDWFPVSGNHDLYWRGPGRPEGEHEEDYETHFGPLSYAFEHKNAWFIALCTDEGGEDGRKTFRDPEAQRMSPRQKEWLQTVLKKAKRADHVFLFQHHPRWIGQRRQTRYGTDWKENVHDAILKTCPNVTAVFAGHTHEMNYDGKADHIEYFTLATTGGKLPGYDPERGLLHHYDLVTVRGEAFSLAVVPVGGILDGRSIRRED